MLAAVAALAAVVAWRGGLFRNAPEPPPHPFASLTPEAIAAVEILGDEAAQPLGSAQVRATAQAIAALRNAPSSDGRTVNWAGARMIRARTRDGIILSLQAVPVGEGAAVRITADAPPDAAPAIKDKANAIRGTRMNAYSLNGRAAHVLVAPTSDSRAR